MKQVLFIRWWEAFDDPKDYHEYLKKRDFNPFRNKKSWRDWVSWALTDIYEMMVPTMPCKQNATYGAWKIWFERHFDYLNDEWTILIWHSLWWAFLLKWLSENTFPKHISQLHLVCPVTSSEWLVWEWIGDFIIDFDKLNNLEFQAKEIFLYHAKNDNVVPYQQSLDLLKHMKKVKFLSFEDREHFNQPALPELLENLWVYTR